MLGTLIGAGASILGGAMSMSGASHASDMADQAFGMISDWQNQAWDAYGDQQNYWQRGAGSLLDRNADTSYRGLGYEDWTQDYNTWALSNWDAYNQHLLDQQEWDRSFMTNMANQMMSANQASIAAGQAGAATAASQNAAFRAMFEEREPFMYDWEETQRQRERQAYLYQLAQNEQNLGRRDQFENYMRQMNQMNLGRQQQFENYMLGQNAYEQNILAQDMARRQQSEQYGYDLNQRQMSRQEGFEDYMRGVDQYMRNRADQVDQYQRDMNLKAYQGQQDYVDYARQWQEDELTRRLSDREYEEYRITEKDKKAARERQRQLSRDLENRQMAEDERAEALQELEYVKSVAAGEREFDLQRYQQDSSKKQSERDWQVSQFEELQNQLLNERGYEINRAEQIMEQAKQLGENLEKVYADLGPMAERRQYGESDVERMNRLFLADAMTDADRAADRVASINESELINRGVDVSGTGDASRRTLLHEQVNPLYSEARTKARKDALDYITGLQNLETGELDSDIKTRQQSFKDVMDAFSPEGDAMSRAPLPRTAATDAYQGVGTGVLERELRSANQFQAPMDIASAIIANNPIALGISDILGPQTASSGTPYAQVNPSEFQWSFNPTPYSPWNPLETINAATLWNPAVNFSHTNQRTMWNPLDTASALNLWNPLETMNQFQAWNPFEGAQAFDHYNPVAMLQALPTIGIPGTSGAGMQNPMSSVMDYRNYNPIESMLGPQDLFNPMNQMNWMQHLWNPVSSLGYPNVPGQPNVDPSTYAQMAAQGGASGISSILGGVGDIVGSIFG